MTIDDPSKTKSHIDFDFLYDKFYTDDEREIGCLLGVLLVFVVEVRKFEI